MCRPPFVSAAIIVLRSVGDMKLCWRELLTVTVSAARACLSDTGKRATLEPFSLGNTALPRAISRSSLLSSERKRYRSQTILARNKMKTIPVRDATAKNTFLLLKPRNPSDSVPANSSSLELLNELVPENNQGYKTVLLNTEHVFEERNARGRSWVLDALQRGAG